MPLHYLNLITWAKNSQNTFYVNRWIIDIKFEGIAADSSITKQALTGKRTGNLWKTLNFIKAFNLNFN